MATFAVAARAVLTRQKDIEGFFGQIGHADAEHGERAASKEKTDDTGQQQEHCASDGSHDHENSNGPARPTTSSSFDFKTPPTALTSTRGSVANAVVFDGPPAWDLGGDRFGVAAGGSVPAFISPSRFGLLRVLVMSGAKLTKPEEDFVTVLRAAPRLERLDASHLNLKYMPQVPEMAACESLRVLFLHYNKLRSWGDLLSAVAPPELLWVSVFHNPVACQPEYRSFLMKHKLSLLLVDHCIVTDSERMDAEPQRWGLSRSKVAVADEGDRFFSCGEKTKFSTEVYLQRSERSEEELIKEHNTSIRDVRQHSAYCSAVCCLQSRWRAEKMRRNAKSLVQRRNAAVLRIQKHAQRYLWRRRMVDYTKDYLAEVDALDLLLDARDMLRQNAMKLIKVAIHQWIYKRQRMKVERESGLCLTRVARGFLGRRRLFKKTFKIDEYPTIYFPEYYQWEFLVLLNIVLKRYGHAPLDRQHHFESADVIGLRMTEPDEIPNRMSSFMHIMQIGMNCLVRPRRRNRYPQRPWDGPTLRLRDQGARARMCIRQRGVHVSTAERKAFLASCSPGPTHPIDHEDQEEEPEDPANPYVSLTMNHLLYGLEMMWPEEARKPGEVLNLFMKEAQKVGTRRKRMCVPVATVEKEKDDTQPSGILRRYNRTCWSQQRLLKFTCPSGREAGVLMRLLHSFCKIVVHPRGYIPTVGPLPFLCEYQVRTISAAVIVQSTWRGYMERQRLRVSVKRQVILHRVAVCIQRAWRWGLLKRRMGALRKALKVAQHIRIPCLYIEERLFTALNVINGLSRLPSFSLERQGQLGYANGNVVFLSDEQTKGRDSRHAIPNWFVQYSGLPAVPKNHRDLTRINGIQGLLLEGAEKADFEATISMPSLVHEAALLASQEPEDSKEAALAASGGVFKFVEIRYPNIAAAKQRALALTLCTYDAKHHLAVPALSGRSMLQDVTLGRRLLRMWAIYGLIWSPTSRIGPFQLRRRGEQVVTDIPLEGCSGRETMPKNWGCVLSGIEVDEEVASDVAEELQETGTTVNMHKTKRDNMVQNAQNDFQICAGEHPNDKLDKEAEGLAAAFAGEESEASSRVLAMLMNDPAMQDALGEGAKDIPMLPNIVGMMPPMTRGRGARRILPDLIQQDKLSLQECTKAARDAELDLAKQKRSAVLSERQSRKAFTQGVFSADSGQELGDGHLPTEAEAAEDAQKGDTHEDFSDDNSETGSDDSEVWNPGGEIDEEMHRALLKAHMAQESLLFQTLQRREQQMKHEAMEMQRQLSEEAKEAIKREEDTSRNEKALATKEHRKVYRDLRDTADHFKSRRAVIHKVFRKADAAMRVEERAQDDAKQRREVLEDWQHRSRVLMQRCQECRQQRRHEVDRLKVELRMLNEERTQQRQEEVTEQRAKNVEQKTIQRLLLAVRRQQLDAEAAAAYASEVLIPRHGGELPPLSPPKVRRTELPDLLANSGSKHASPRRAKKPLAASAAASPEASPVRSALSATAPIAGWKKLPLAFHDAEAEALSPKPPSEVSAAWMSPPMPPPPPCERLPRQPALNPTLRAPCLPTSLKPKKPPPLKPGVLLVKPPSARWRHRSVPGAPTATETAAAWGAQLAGNGTGSPPITTEAPFQPSGSMTAR
eukprot:TRINITY_DN44797_c0_g1_i4.p1 TRINITY_DN44797_c0_g1~~TRINITY_DN44797_c0_g1_i4.p1  ORF type:complete len:1628 (-),score=420.11 TRINITY_DN44797_c0_g1_i4:254-5137(-)